MGNMENNPYFRRSIVREELSDEDILNIKNDKAGEIYGDIKVLEQEIKDYKSGILFLEDLIRKSVEGEDRKISKVITIAKAYLYDMIDAKERKETEWQDMKDSIEDLKKKINAKGDTNGRKA